MPVVNQPTQWIRDNGSILTESTQLLINESGDFLVNESGDFLLVSQSSDGLNPVTEWEDIA
jgi:hypothetical protein